jgi:galactokinase
VAVSTMLMEPLPGPDEAVEARIDAFRRSFGRPPSVLAWAPGRINLIGEHIDYCGGTVLPFAIQPGTWVAAGDAPDRLLRAVSDQYPGIAEAALAALHDDTADAAARTCRIEPWFRYPLGVWQELAGTRIGSADEADGAATKRGHALTVAGPLMAFGGLSSSASLCLAVAIALAARLRRPIGRDPLAMARLCQTVEHRYLGVSCGIMDQAVIALARPGHALALRCDSLHYDYVPLPLRDHAVLAVHSGVPRALAASPYNARQDQVRLAEAVLRWR